MGTALFEHTDLRVRPGYVGGSLCPVIIIDVETRQVYRAHEQPASVLEHLLWGERVQEQKAHVTTADDYLTRWTQALAARLKRVSQLLVDIGDDKPSLHRIDPENEAASDRLKYRIYWPCIAFRALLPTLSLALHYSKIAASDQDMDEAKMRWKRTAEQLLSALPTGVNTSRFFQAAKRLGYTMSLPNGLCMRIGEGCHARDMMGASTDSTPMIGMFTAKNKYYTADILRQEGLPVPVNIPLTADLSPLTVAEKLGYPLVVKPLAKDRGEGVEAGIRDPDSLLKAVARAREVSPNVMLEKHHEGQEFRLLVINGKLLWAHERVPAIMLGDGTHTLQALINQQNHLRRQQDQGSSRSLKPFYPDPADLRYLAAQGISLDDIPAAGVSVRVQVIPNASKGGKGRAVYDLIHPDNAELAVKAANRLNLDIAGIDVITRDIAQSWKAGGLVVTEVNSQPEMSELTNHQLFEQALEELIPALGRIPVVFCIDGHSNAAWLRDLVSIARSSDIRVIQQENPSSDAAQTTWSEAFKAMSSQETEALMVITDGSALAQLGSPFAHIDLLLSDNSNPKASKILAPYVIGQQVDTTAIDKIGSTDIIEQVLNILLEDEAEKGVKAWLLSWEAHIRARDYDKAQALFDPSVLSFGTRIEKMDNLDSLVIEQWQPVWSTTQNFTIDQASLRLHFSDERGTVLAAALWTGEACPPDEHSEPVPRRGRVSVLLRKKTGRWLAEHTHLSLSPDSHEPADRDRLLIDGDAATGANGSAV